MKKLSHVTNELFEPHVANCNCSNHVNTFRFHACTIEYEQRHSIGIRFFRTIRKLSTTGGTCIQLRADTPVRCSLIGVGLTEDEREHTAGIQQSNISDADFQKLNVEIFQIYSRYILRCRDNRDDTVEKVCRSSALSVR